MGVPGPNGATVTTPSQPQFAVQQNDAVDDRIRTRTRATVAKLAPNVALVERALQGAGPGDLPLKAGRLVEGMQASFAADAGLKGKVEGMLAQYRDAVAALETASGPDLMTASFFLSRLSESVKTDPLLAQLFPAPQLLEAQASDAD
ncbi:MAG: hypothetical protein JWM80_4893 [Cyanobacteria bacterium RYN_339]|nr:hypothetical protein [Cyanobacteria bacterium RYN_339]